MTFQRFDFHCHVDLHRSPPDFLAHLESEAICTLAVTTLPAAVPQNLVWASTGRYVHVGCGLHPELVAGHKNSAARLFELIPTSSIVGEIGIDGSRHHRTSLKAQEAIFRKAISLSGRRHATLLSIHSRGAAEQVVQILEGRESSQECIPILHWYSGSLSIMKRAAEAGCYFSVNEKMLASEQGRRLVERMPRDRLISETDAPFTTDGSTTGHMEALKGLEFALAKTLQLSQERVCELLSRNGQRILMSVAPSRQSH